MISVDVTALEIGARLFAENDNLDCEAPQSRQKTDMFLWVSPTTVIANMSALFDYQIRGSQ